MQKLLVTALGILPAMFAMSAMAAETINAAGATFPAPIYQKWFSEYRQAHPEVQINYQALGSGAGIRQLAEGTVDFGASDQPMNDDQIKAAKVHPLHFPTVLGADVITYNIPGVTAQLKLSPEAIAGIFLGAITKWSDAKLKADNPGVNLPNNDILVVHRSDSSGTSFIFTDYLSKVSAEWKSKVGANASVAWPVGLGGKGSDGVTGLIKQTPYSVGYVELVFAVQNKLGFASVKNAAGKFVAPSFQSVSQAAANSRDLPDDFRASIVSAPGAGSYPISSFTWLLIPSRISDPTKRKAITGFLQWMMTTGQKDCEGLSYAQLPQSVVVKEQKQIALIK